MTTTRTRPARAPRRVSASPKEPASAKATPAEEQLYERVAEILEQARGQVARSVNTAMVNLAFPKDSEIRTGGLSESATSTTPIRSGSPSEFEGRWFPAALGWTHYLVLMRVANTDARAFYEIEAARERWSGEWDEAERMLRLAAPAVTDTDTDRTRSGGEQ